MSQYADAELTALSKDLGSDFVKRKRSGTDRQAIRRNICAFANDISGRGEPGVVFIGLEADGTCSGIRVDDTLLSRLAQMRSDGAILPFPSMSVERRVVEGCELAVVTVQPSIDAPVRFQGRVWIKVGPTVQQATPDEERQIGERRRAADLPFDLRSSTAKMGDLDRARIQHRYLPRAAAKEVLEQNEHPLDDQLRSLRLATGDHPTRGALIAFGKVPQFWSPCAYVQFLRLGGESLTDPIQTQAALNGQLEDILTQLDRLAESNIAVRTDITSGPQECRRPDYPLVAIQQLARNALMHRSYEATNAPVRIHWFSNRLEIRSPGGLYGSVTSANIGTGETDYRNPLIAEIMHRLGFAQRFGVGLPLAREAMEANGNPPLEFDFSPTHVSVTLRPAP